MNKVDKKLVGYVLLPDGEVTASYFIALLQVIDTTSTVAVS